MKMRGAKRKGSNDNKKIVKFTVLTSILACDIKC